MGKLHNVHIASPCSSDWEKMIGDERVRHCSQCNLNVYNLSAMTGLEAQELVAKHEGRLCLRFYHRKDGTILTRNCPVGLKVVMQRASRVAGIALSAVMGTSPLAAQVRQQPPTQVVQAEADTGLEIHVVDRDEKDCPGVTVELKNLSDKSVVKVITDKIGMARLTKLSPGSHLLTISSSEFAPYEQGVWVREHEMFKLEISKDPPVIETTTAQAVVTGNAAPKTTEHPPLIDNRQSVVMQTFSNMVLATGAAVVENSPIQQEQKAEQPHHGLLHRAFSKLLHLK